MIVKDSNEESWNAGEAAEVAALHFLLTQQKIT